MSSFVGCHVPPLAISRAPPCGSMTARWSDCPRDAVNWTRRMPVMIRTLPTGWIVFILISDQLSLIYGQCRFVSQPVLCATCVLSNLAAGDGSLVSKRSTPWSKPTIQARTWMHAWRSGMQSMRNRSRPGGYTACASIASVSVGRTENTHRGRCLPGFANGKFAVIASRNTRTEFTKPAIR